MKNLELKIIFLNWLGLLQLLLMKKKMKIMEQGQIIIHHFRKKGQEILAMINLLHLLVLKFIG